MGPIDHAFFSSSSDALEAVDGIRHEYALGREETAVFVMRWYGSDFSDIYDAWVDDNDDWD